MPQKSYLLQEEFEVAIGEENPGGPTSESQPSQSCSLSLNCFTEIIYLELEPNSVCIVPPCSDMLLIPLQTFSLYSHFTRFVHSPATDIYLPILIMTHRLGQGGFGEVYLCVHRESGIRYALKVLEHADEVPAYPISRECRIAKLLDHVSDLSLVLSISN